MVKLFYHEAVRQFADKILMKHDLEWFMTTLRQVIWDTFDLKPFDEDFSKVNTKKKKEDGEDDNEEDEDEQEESKKSQNDADSATKEIKVSEKSYHDPNERVWPIKDEDNLWYSVMNMDVEGYYTEFKSPEKSNLTIVEEIHQKV